MTYPYRTSYTQIRTLRTAVLTLVLFVAAVLAAPGAHAQHLSSPTSETQIMLGDIEGHTPSTTPAHDPMLTHRGPEVLLDQLDNSTLRYIAFRGDPVSDIDATSADDFVVPEGVAWTIQEVFVDGSYLEIPNPHPNGPARCLAADLGFWSDADGLPGDPLFFYEGVAPTSDDSGDLTIPIEDTELPSGTYWFSVQCSGDLREGLGIRGFYWNRNDNASSGTFGSPGAVINPDGGLAFPEDGWNSLSDLPEVENSYDFSFILSGTSQKATANEDEGLLGALILKAAYPNPFARSAVVAFEAREPTAVRVAVYDVLGREVAVLVDGSVSGGPHEARLDGTALSSGIYLIRMTTEDGATQTRRITLAR